MSKEKIPKAIRNAVWNHNIGNSKEGECYTGCGEKISINNFACGHVISEKKGGKVILDNLKPICVACNSSMGTMNMDDFINKYGLKKDNNINKIIENKSNQPIKSLIDCETNFNLELLKIKELRNICDFYKIPYKKKNKKSELLDIIKNTKNFDYNNYLKKSLESLQIKDLKNICQELNLSKNGKKKDLIDKIINSKTIIEMTDYIDINSDNENDDANSDNDNFLDNNNSNILCTKCLRYGHDYNQCNYNTISTKLPFDKWYEQLMN